MNSLLDPSELAGVLRAHGLPPLDRFGQHFLVNADVLDAMVRAADSDPRTPIVEVGAGLGVLTRALARARAAPIVAVEIDRRLIPLLTDRVKEFPFVHVIAGDILRLSPSSLPLGPSASFDVIGNIPYNISARLLRHVLSWSPRPRRVTFLLDAAVATRITATPPDMNLLAVSVQVFAEPTIARSGIPPSAFVPQPKVQSAIVRLDTRRVPLVPDGDAPVFFSLVRAGFAQRRKMLKSALGALWRCSAADASARIKAAGIDPTRRAQTLTIAEWLTLTRASPRAPDGSRT